MILRALPITITALVLAGASAQAARADDYGVSFHYDRGGSYCDSYAYPRYRTTYSRSYFRHGGYYPSYRSRDIHFSYSRRSGYRHHDYRGYDRHHYRGHGRSYRFRYGHRRY